MVNLLEIIKRKDIAKGNGYWLESLALAHLFVETQLNILVSSHCTERELRKAKRYHVWGLGNLAKENGLIRQDTWIKIERFNKARNKTIHGLASGEITYDEIKQHVFAADELIADLQRYYAKITIGREMRADE